MYDRQKAYEYAKKWAFGRNPNYYNFDSIGGDCTNFVSQCIFAGCHKMNYCINNGWYYIDGNHKSPSWTGVSFLYDFLVSNQGVGPIGKKTTINNLQVGDIIQFCFDQQRFTHSVIVVQPGTNVYDTLVAAHTYDTFDKPVAGYHFKQLRCIHITKA